MTDEGIPEKVAALESILVEKGYVHRRRSTRSSRPTRRRRAANGARVVARAWVDPAYRECLRAGRHRRHRRARATAAARASTWWRWRTPRGAPPRRLHALLLLPVAGAGPAARLVQVRRPTGRARCIDPRGVLADFGVTLPDDTRSRVWDSTAEVRYLVVPMRPAGTEDLDEEALAALVTRDAMIGTASWAA